MRLVRLAAAVITAATAALPAAAQQTCEVPAFRGAQQPGGAQATMRVVNTGQPCRVETFMRFEPQRIPYVSAEVTRAPANGTATATGQGIAYMPRPGFAGTDSFVVVSRGEWQGRPVTGQITFDVTVLPRP
jgi:phage tail tape-measure protein